MNELSFIVITGATATGKTDIAVLVAKMVNGEIISADSMQIYKDMDIGTAKPSREEMGGIPHHLIDELSPDEAFSVARFKEMACARMEDIQARGKFPIIVGGTGFYINALVKSTVFNKTDVDEGLREELKTFAQKYGNAALRERLRAVDPESAQNIHENNVKRIIRAIEFHNTTGAKISAHNELEISRKQDGNAVIFVLDMERTKLYERINRRVDVMIERGLAGEVERLLKMGYSPELPSMQGLGYKEMARYLRGETTLEQAVYDIKIGTRHFAKRQLTWFRNKMQCVRVDVTDLKSEAVAKTITNQFDTAAIL